MCVCVPRHGREAWGKMRVKALFFQAVRQCLCLPACLWIGRPCCWAFMHLLLFQVSTLLLHLMTVGRSPFSFLRRRRRRRRRRPRLFLPPPPPRSRPRGNWVDCLSPIHNRVAYTERNMTAEDVTTDRCGDRMGRRRRCFTLAWRGKKFSSSST